jgi:hypothetical protein
LDTILYTKKLWELQSLIIYTSIYELESEPNTATNDMIMSLILGRIYSNYKII